MKNFLKNMSVKARVAFCTLMCALTAAPAAMAQTQSSEVDNILSSSANAMNGIIPGVVKVLKIVVVIGAAISLLMVVFNIIQGERDAAKKAGWWLVGLALGFAALSILGGMTIN